MKESKQIKAAKENIKKAQMKWQSMTPRQRALAQPGGRMRTKPGIKGTGDYYRIIVRPKYEFITFRYHDVGDPGHVQRLSGKRSSGSWSTQAWLVAKSDAHREGKKLVPDSPGARKIIDTLKSPPVHVEADIFKAKDRPNIAEKDKPTKAQKHAQMTNIKKAQRANRMYA